MAKSAEISIQSVIDAVVDELTASLRRNEGRIQIAEAELDLALIARAHKSSKPGARVSVCANKKVPRGASQPIHRLQLSLSVHLGRSTDERARFEED